MAEPIVKPEPHPDVVRSLGRQQPEDWAADLMAKHQADLILGGQYDPDPHALETIATAWRSLHGRYLQALAAIDRVHELHSPEVVPNTYLLLPDSDEPVAEVVCSACGDEDAAGYPCDTISALGPVITSTTDPDTAVRAPGWSHVAVTREAEDG